MKLLELWTSYTREEVHSIFSPDTPFTPQAGTWGLQGMVRVPDRQGDWVFFVTFGQVQGEHIFDESITEDGVLSWQSQPSQGLSSDVIKSLIGHDDRVNNIHLFLRTRRGAAYGYFGTLGYLTHDAQRENPVHFQWWRPQCANSAISGEYCSSRPIPSQKSQIRDKRLTLDGFSTHRL